MAERVRIEHTSTRKRADNGFEDREGHQAPITLRGKKEKTEALANAADFIDDGVRLGKLASGDLRINFLSIYGHFKHAASGRDQAERSDPLLEL